MRRLITAPFRLLRKRKVTSESDTEQAQEQVPEEINHFAEQEAIFSLDIIERPPAVPPAAAPGLSHRRRQKMAVRTAFVSDMLRAYPISGKNSNKVILPVSLLKEITDKELLDDREKDKPLIFEITCADPDTGDVVGETHASVEDFTAPNGTVGIPYKTALSLTQEKGISWLNENPLVFIRYVEIPSAKESLMKVQPRGKGFFSNDKEALNLDIKAVLEKTMRDQVVLSIDDWIPLFFDGNRVELVVKDLQPHEVIDVLNTDLTVDILPSEEVEQTMQQKEEAQKLMDDFMSERERRFREKSKTMEESIEPPKTDKDVTMVRVRLPKGGSLSRRVRHSDKLSHLLDMIEVMLYKADYVPLHLPEPGVRYFFNLLYTVPRQPRKLIDSDKYYQKTIGEVLKEFELNPHSLSLTLQFYKPEENEQENVDEPIEGQQKRVYINDEWARLADRLESQLNEAESENPAPSSEEVEEVVALLVGNGVAEEEAQSAARVYPKEIKTLAEMGYGSQFAVAVPLLRTHKGDVQAVVTALLGV